MKKALILYIFLLISVGSFAQKNNSSDTSQDKSKKSEADKNVQQNDDKGTISDQDQKKSESNKSDHQTQDTRYQEGASGVKRSISYKFSSIISDTDPGKGNFRYNRDTVSGITYIFIDDIDLTGEDQTKWYSTWEDSTGATGRGRLNIVEYEGKNINVFDVKGVFKNEDGYWKIPVTYVSGSLPADGVTYFYIFERIENKDKSAKEEKSEKKIKVKEVIAGGVVAAVAAVTKEEPQIAQVTEEKKEEVVQVEPVLEAKTEPVNNPDTVKQEVKVEAAAEITAAVAVAAVVAVPIEEPQPVQVAEEKKEEIIPVAQPETVVEAKVEPVVQADTVKKEIKVSEAAEIAAVETVAAVVTSPEVEKQPVQVAEGKKEEQPVIQVTQSELAPSPEPVKKESKVEEATGVAAVVTVAAVVAEPKAEPQPVQIVEEKKPETVVEIKQEPAAPAEPAKQESKVVEVAATTTLVTIAAVAAKPMEETQPVNFPEPAPAQPVQVVEEKKSEPVQTVPVAEEKKPEMAQPVQSVKEPKPAPAVIGVAVAAGQSEKPKEEPRVSTVQESLPAPKTQAPQESQPAKDSQPVQTSESARPAQQAPVSQPKTTTQSSQPQQPAPVKKDTPVSQPAQPPRQTQPVQSKPAQSEKPVTSGRSVSKRTDGSGRWHGIIETGYSFKVGDYGINNYRLNFIGSFRLSQYFSIGLGIGYRRYFDKPEKHPEWYTVSSKSQIPVFIDLRAVLSKKKLSPYLAFGFGSTTKKSTSDNTKYGSFMNPSAGAWYRLSTNTAVFAGIAYEMQQLDFANFSDNIPYLKNSNSLSLNIGISF